MRIYAHGSRTHLINALRTNEGLDPEPEHSQDNATDDAKIAQPKSKRGAIDDGEGCVKPGPNGAIQHHDGGNDNVSYCYGWQCLPPMSSTLAMVPVNRHWSYQDKPIASIDEANSHMAAFVASEIQYAT